MLKFVKWFSVNLGIHNSLSTSVLLFYLYKWKHCIVCYILNLVLFHPMGIFPNQYIGLLILLYGILGNLPVQIINIHIISIDIHVISFISILQMCISVCMCVYILTYGCKYINKDKFLTVQLLGQNSCLFYSTDIAKLSFTKLAEIYDQQKYITHIFSHIIVKYEYYEALFFLKK